MFDKSWIVLKATRCWINVSIYWYGALFACLTKMKAAIHLGHSLQWTFCCTYRNTNFDALKTLFDIAQKLSLESEAWDSGKSFHEGTCAIQSFSGQGEMGFATVAKDPSVERAKLQYLSKSPVLGFRRMHLDNRMAKEPSWTFWVEYLHRSPTHYIAKTQRDSGNNDSSSNKSWRIWRSNHIHVHVQRHRLDPEGKLWWMLFEF